MRKDRRWEIGAQVRHVRTDTRGYVVGLHVQRDGSQWIEVEYVKQYSREVVTMWRPKLEFKVVK